MDEKQTFEKHTFVKTVLNWSVTDIVNPGKFADKVAPVPLRFRTRQEYRDAFKWPLLEDTRAQLQQSLESIGSSAYFPLQTVVGIPRHKENDDEIRMLGIDIWAEGTESTEKHNSRASWVPKSTDLALLANLVPRSWEDLQRAGASYALVQIASSSFYEGDELELYEDNLFSIKAKVSRTVDCPEFRNAREGHQKPAWFLVYFDTLATRIRMWNALSPHVHAFETSIGKVADEILCSQDMKESHDIVSVGEGGSKLDSIVEKYCSSKKLNLSQTEAVTHAVTSVVRGTGQRVNLIQGPPGTGKTTTTTVLVSIASCLKDRVLVCTPTNRAISEVAERFLRLLEENVVNTSQFSDFMPFVTDEVDFCRPLHLGDVVLVGNKEKLDMTGSLQAIFLSHRMRRLSAALSSRFGWVPSMTFLTDLLKRGLEKFLLEVEGISKVNGSSTQKTSFLQFFRENLNRHGRSVIACGQTLCNDLPSTMLSPLERREITEACALIEKLLKCAAVKSLSSADIKQLFAGAGGHMGCGCGSQGRHLSSYVNDMCTTRKSILEKRLGEASVCKLPNAGLQDRCLSSASLVFCTISTAGSRAVKEAGSFDYVVVDEAAQVTEAETAIVTQQPGLNDLLLVGDPQQLQALVLSQAAKRCHLGRSLFQRLQENGHVCHLLNEQRRMHPEISRFPNKQFYGGRILDGPNVISPTYKLTFVNEASFGPYAFVNVTNTAEESDQTTGSWRNPMEAEVVVRLVSKIRSGYQRAGPDGSRVMDVGVITPYRGQADLLQKKLALSYGSAPSLSTVPHQLDAASGVVVNTVDGFQGGEKDVIIFSAVRSNPRGSIGFVEDARRLNVAITRGRFCVWIVGNASTLEHRNELWRELIENSRERCCFRNVGDDAEIRKFVTKVNDEKEKFASLLHNNSVLFHEAIWQVHFSKQFKDAITEMESKEDRRRIISTVLNLAKGRRPSYRTECALAREEFRNLIHVHPTGGLTLVWTIDVQRKSPVQQIIKVWDIVAPKFLAGLVKRLEAGFSTYTEDYLKLCETKKLHVRKKLFVPAMWSFDSCFPWLKISSSSKEVAGRGGAGAAGESLEKATVEESVLLMKFYSLTSTSAAADGSTLEFLMEVSGEQAVIIADPYSCFILGRSGTGKTTVITSRLLLKEMALAAANACETLPTSSAVQDLEGAVVNDMALDLMRDAGIQHVRQIIVTLSPKLCTAIKHHVDKAFRTSTAANHRLEADHGQQQQRDVVLDDAEDSKLMDNIPDSFINMAPQYFPLVITFRKFLEMINGSVSSPFTTRKMPRKSAGKSASLQRKKDPHAGDSKFTESSAVQKLTPARSYLEDGRQGMQNIDDDEEEEFDVSFDMELDEDDNRTEAEASVFDSYASPADAEVTFERFTSSYWPHFSSNFTKPFDSSVVFTEVLSSIKGSLEALDSEKGRLTRQQYLSIAGRKASSFDEKQRELIYTLFEQYEKLKSARREYDIADLCMHLYRQLERGNYNGAKFHFIYVDEVQDLTVAQIVLFKFVCTDVERGFVFAGDTAQTIARGVNFRFQDIRDIFYRKFLGKGSPQGAQEGGDASYQKLKQQKRSTQSRVSGCLQQQHMPDIYQLSHNYRTHIGIVNIANSIVQLLYRFFPNSVDKLDAESSFIDGDMPTFLKEEEKGDFVTKLFGNGGATGAGGCEFGAEQVILVRSDEEKRRMLARLGNRALVMTVLDCKGLEFQDVLAYNFFAHSEFKTKWRVVYSAVAEAPVSKGLLKGRSTSFPQFDDHKHRLLMSELKQLYVVVTRARQRLWFYDEAPENHEPMLDYWSASRTISAQKLDDELLKSMHGISTPEDWKRRGLELLRDKQYELAESSFSRAGDAYNAKYAKALSIQRAGESCFVANRTVAVRHLREAAELFTALEKHDLAAKCYLKVEDYRIAGEIFRNKCKPSQREDAANCFLRGRFWGEAAQVCRSFSLEQCLTACWQGKLLEVGLEVLQEWESAYKKRSGKTPHTVSDQLVAIKSCSKEEFESLKMKFLKNCALHYHGEKQPNMMMKFVRHFSSFDLKKTFLKRRDYYDELMEVEIAEGNMIGAAEMAEGKGDMKHAFLLLVQGGHFELALQKVLPCASFEMLWDNGKAGWPLSHTQKTQELLRLANDSLRGNTASVPGNLFQELQLLLLAGENSSEIWDAVKESTHIHLQVIAGRWIIESTLSQYNKMLSASRRSVDEDIKVSLAQMFSIWRTWSAALISLMGVSSRAQLRRETLKDEHILECCLRYFGAVKQAQSHLLLVPDANAAWVKNCNATLIPNQSPKSLVNCQQAFEMAEKFWALQLFRVGINIVDMFGKLFYRGGKLTFRKEDFMWRGEQLCTLYRMTQTLAENLCPTHLHGEEQHSEVMRRLKDCGSQIYELSFPSRLTAGDAADVVCFRHLVRLHCVYDNIATYMLSEICAGALPGSRSCGKEDVTSESERLQVLLPLLSKQWVESHDREKLQRMLTVKKNFSWDFWLMLWEVSRKIYIEDRSKLVQVSRFGWVKTVEDYVNVVVKIPRQYRTFVDPFVFVHLLERAVVMEFASRTHLETFVLPESLVANHMTGENDTNLYSCILKLKRKSAYEKNMEKVADMLQFMVKVLNSANDQFQRWLTDVHVPLFDRPSLILRLVAVFLTACMNSYSMTILTVADGLSTFFRSGSPFLRTLRQEYQNEVKNGSDILQGLNQPVAVARCRAAFTKAMTIVGDPFVVLQCKEEAHSAHGLEIRKMLVCSVKDGKRFFTTDYQQAITENFAEGDGRSSSEIAEAVDSDEHQGFEDQSLVNKLAPWEDRNASLDKSSDAPTLQPSGSGHDDIITKKFKLKLLKCLEEARKRLNTQLSPVEKYQRDASAIFAERNMLGSEYATVFRNQACRSRVEAEELLRKLGNCLEVLKKGTTRSNVNTDEGFDAIADAQEELQKAIFALDPRQEQHQGQNLGSLRILLGEVRDLLEAGERTWENHNFKVSNMPNASRQRRPADGGKAAQPANDSRKQKSKKKAKKKKRGGW